MPLDLIDLFEGLDFNSFEVLDLTEMVNQYQEPEAPEDPDCVWVLTEEEWNSIPY